ncbi:MAG: GntR family transcriptional regulator [Peptostreptococcales bacterium]|jgi:DNA-binding GntR family transcriptional regulator
MEKFTIDDHKPLRDLVFEEIRRSILSGELKPGQRLMEIELADRLGVSRTPIREAIRKLELEGLVAIEVRKGAYVSGISVSEMIDVLVVRSVLEGLAASLAAQKITEEEIKALLEISEKFNQSVAEDDAIAMNRYNNQFHNIIFEATKNKKLIQMANNLQEVVQRFKIAYFKEYTRAKDIPQEHKLIVQAICARDPVTAKEYGQNHVERLTEALEEERKKISQATFY